GRARPSWIKAHGVHVQAEGARRDRITIRIPGLVDRTLQPTHGRDSQILRREVRNGKTGFAFSRQRHGGHSNAGWLSVDGRRDDARAVLLLSATRQPRLPHHHCRLQRAVSGPVSSPRTAAWASLL